jgi:hypothetical protein
LLTLAIKVNTVLLLLLALVVAAWKRLPRENFKAALCLCIPLFLLLVNFAITNKSSGIRHMLAVVFLLFIILSKLAALKKSKNWMKAGIAVLLVLYAAESVLVAPHYLSHANLFAGGPAHAHGLVVGSNIDLGQDLKGLKEYMEENKVKKVRFSYFGSIDPSEYGISYDYLPSPAFLPWVPDYTVLSLEEREEDCSPKKGMVVVLWEKKPKTTIGYTLWVYDLSSPQNI